MLKTVIAGVLSLALLPAGGAASVAKAEVLDQADYAFLEFFSENEAIDYGREPLYNQQLQQNGWEYKFERNGENGYALVSEVTVCGQSYFEVEEVYLQGTSPFDACAGLPVYIAFNSYIDCVNGAYFDLATGAELSVEELQTIAERGFNYQGAGTEIERTEIINYANRSEEKGFMDTDVPDYMGVEGGNSCANIAGGIVIGYYDRFCENLIPNFQSYELFSGYVLYKGMSGEAGEVIKSLNGLMGTNSSGTTFSGFQAGMNSYVKSHGYTYSSTSVMSNGTFDFTKYEQAIKNNIPVALFFNYYAVGNVLTTSTGTDKIISGCSSASHVAIGCGYKQHTYYDTNGNVISVRRYLRVASGFYDTGLCFYNITTNSKIDNAIAITIS